MENVTHKRLSLTRRRSPGGIIAGALYPLRALALIGGNSRLWRYVAIPILVNLLVGVTLYAGLLAAGWWYIGTLVADLPEWAALLRVLLQALLVIVLLISTGFVLVRFGVVLGAPWYS